MDCIEIFDMDSHRWIGAALNFDFTLKTDCHLFIRRLGVVQCQDFKVLLGQSKQQSRPGHLRHNMKGERDAVRGMLKARRGVLSEESEHDSDLEIVSVRKRVREGSIEIVDRTPTRVRMDPTIISLSPSSTCFSQSPTSSQLPVSPMRGTLAMLTPVDRSLPVEFSSPPPTPEARTLPSIAQVQVPVYDSHGRDVWPAGMYTVDMAAGFRQMKDRGLRARYLQPALFRQIFGVPFVKGTYQDNLRAWQTTSTAILDQFEKAGRTPEGLWARYLAARRVALGEHSKRSSGPSKLRGA